MKKIKVAFLYDKKEWMEYLSQFYEVEISENPDYVICESSTALECVYRYDCVRIIRHGENVRPDFNLFDYAIGFDQMIFHDRYLYYPLFMSYRSDLEKALEKHLKDDSFYRGKEGFCNFVVSNGHAANPIRDELLDRLSTYKKVDSAGRYRNNMPDGKPVGDKFAFQQKYRFSLALENSSYTGYTTEKIIQAFAAGTIPIYWGDPSVAELFNEKAFINCHSFQTLEEVIGRVKEVNENEELWMAMLKEPIVNPDGEILRMLEKNYLDKYLKHIFDQDPKDALRRTNARDGWGYFAERDAKYFWEMTHSKLVRAAYKMSRIWNNLWKKS